MATGGDSGTLSAWEAGAAAAACREETERTEEAEEEQCEDSFSQPSADQIRVGRDSTREGAARS